ncbi:MAG: hypothetical protein U9R60_03040 [Bacteroidota bacterium]|nr:hypothetical protein [Bacteroidota bacterium]
MKSQTINIDSTFTADAEIYPFSPDDTITGLSIGGSIELNSDTSLVRVILVDEDYNEYMVYEAYPMIGSIVESLKINDTNYLTVIDIEDYQPGIYLFNFIDDHQILESHKIIISR